MTQLARRVGAEPIGIQGGAMQGFEASAGNVGELTLHAGTASVVSREEAELKASIVLARSSPRNEQAAWQRILASFARPGMAEKALYAFPRGGKTVKGPTVKLARDFKRLWGNIRSGIRIVTIDKDYVHVKGYAHDLEANTYVDQEAKFARLQQRKGKDGETRWVEPDERDLRELVNNIGGRCERNCIIQLMPPDFVEDAIEQSKQTLLAQANGELKQDKATTVKRLLSSFAEVGVFAAHLTEYVGHALDQMTGDELANLRTVYASIRSGEAVVADFFQLKKVQPEKSKVQTAIGALGGEPEPASDAAGATASDSPAEHDADAGGTPDQPASGLNDDQRGVLESMGDAAKPAPTSAERFAAAKKKATGK